MQIKILDYNGQGTKLVELGPDLVTWTVKDITGDYIPLTQKGQASGVAPLDSEGYVPSQHIKQILLNNNIIVADETERFAANVPTGTFAIQLDDDTVWVKLNNDAPPTNSDDWAQLILPASVVSVNGQTGNVVIDLNALLAYGSSQTQFDNAVAVTPVVAQILAALSMIDDVINAIEFNIVSKSYTWTATANQTDYVIPGAIEGEIGSLISVHVGWVPQDLNSGLVDTLTGGYGIKINADSGEIEAGDKVMVVYGTRIE